MFQSVSTFSVLDCKGKIYLKVFCARLQGQDLFQSVSTFSALDCKDEICFNLFEGFLC